MNPITRRVASSRLRSSSEIRAVLFSLTASPSVTSNTDILEALYCVALLLLAGQEKFRITPRFHYNLITAIYFFENSGPSLEGATTVLLRLVVVWWKGCVEGKFRFEMVVPIVS